MDHWLAGIPAIAVLLAVVGVVLIESIGLPLPGETVVIAATLVATAGGSVAPWQVAVAALVGSVTGDVLGYLIGRRWGVRLFGFAGRRWPRMFGPARMDHARSLVSRRGIWAVVFGRFIALLRLFVAPLAGTLGMPFRRFLIADLVGSTLWSVGIVVVVSLLGRGAIALVHGFAWAGVALAVLAAVIVGAIVDRRARGTRSAADTVLLPIWRHLRATPFTSLFALVYIGFGVASMALWRPLVRQPLFDAVAYGLPAFSEGRWWTLVTGAVCSGHPYEYALLIPAVLVFGAWSERRYGTLRTTLIFVAGQVFATLAAALTLVLLAPTGWPWAVDLSQMNDVGPSTGVLATVAAVCASTRSPWRLRLRIVLASAVTIALVYIGTLADLEHFFAVIPAMIIVHFALRRRGIGRPTVREARLLIVSALLAIAVVLVLVTLVPSDDPLGSTTSGGLAWLDVLTDVVVIAIITGLLARGRWIGWLIALILAVINVVEFVALIVLALVSQRFPSDLLVSIANNAIWVALLVMLVLGRGAFRASIRRSRRSLDGARTVDDPRAALRANGGGTLSWMTLWPGTDYFAGSDGESYLGYQLRSDVALVLGDPIGAPEHRAQTVREFVDACQRLGIVPALFSVGDATVAATPPGWQRLTVAEDTIVDLPTLELTGKRWNNIRTAINRAARENVDFRMTRLADEAPSIVAQVREISEEWVGDKALPEMGFTLGGVDEALDPQVRAGIALDPDGIVQGVTSWLPVYGPGGEIRGWTLDLMRKRDGGSFKPVMEFLIAESALAFKAEGAQFVSLSGAPLARSGEVESEGIDAVIDRIAQLLEPLYGFQSLHAFKQKFNPRYETMSLAYRDGADLPRIALALTRAYLPNSSMLQIARMGLTSGR